MNPNITTTSTLTSNQTLVTIDDVNVIPTSKTTLIDIYNNYQNYTLDEILQNLNVSTNEDVNDQNNVGYNINNFKKLSDTCSIVVIDGNGQYTFEISGPISNIKVSSTQKITSTTKLCIIDTEIERFWLYSLSSLNSDGSANINNISALGVAFLIEPKVTYLLNSQLTTSLAETSINFTSLGESFTSIKAINIGVTSPMAGVWYDESQVYGINWTNEAYRTLVFDEEPTGDLLTWLNTNGTKQ